MRLPHAPAAALCSHCGKDATGKSRCSTCRTSYCGAECQRSDWQLHKLWHTKVRFVVSEKGHRKCVSAKSNVAGSLLFVEKPDATAPCISDLFDRDENMREYFPPSTRVDSIAQAFDQANWAASDIAANYAMRPPSETRTTAAERAADANGTPMYSLLTNQQYGVALYSRFRYVNHACVPNAAYVIGKGGKVYLFALSDLDENDEVCISYAPVRSMMCTCLRRRVIRQAFGFECTCALCTARDCAEPASEDLGKWIPEGHSVFDPLYAYPLRHGDKGYPIKIHEDDAYADISDGIASVLHYNESLVEMHQMFDTCIALISSGKKHPGLGAAAEDAAVHAAEHYIGPLIPSALLLAAKCVQTEGTMVDAHLITAIIKALREKYAWHESPMDFSPMGGIVDPRAYEDAQRSLGIYELAENAIAEGARRADESLQTGHGKDEEE